jgi:hypothetical protein
MKPKRLLSDVNLSDITIPAATATVVLSFLNMSDGRAVESLVCNGVIVFAYQTPMGRGLPQYVGEVNHVLLSSNDAVAVLQRLGYGFTESGPKVRLV